MDKLSLKAQERTVLGKKVKNLRSDGVVPGHVYGSGVEGENVMMKLKDLMPVIDQAGETGLIDLKIGDEKVRPVLIRGLDKHAVSGDILNVDFFQVNLKEKVTVPVPIVLVGEETELVHIGEAVVLQTLNEVEVEALPTDLIEHIEVNIEVLKQIDDAITVDQLNYDRSKLTVLAESDEVVVKLAPAVTEEMKALLEEQEAETAAAAEVAEAAEGEEVGEGEEGVEGEESTVSEKVEDGELVEVENSDKESPE